MPSGSLRSRQRRHRQTRSRKRLQTLNAKFREYELPTAPTMTQAERQRPALRVAMEKTNKSR